MSLLFSVRRSYLLLLNGDRTSVIQTPDILRLDYFNSLFIGLKHWSNMEGQNSAQHRVLSTQQFRPQEHITCGFLIIHQLPLCILSQFKSLCLTLKSDQKIMIASLNLQNPLRKLCLFKREDPEEVQWYGCTLHFWTGPHCRNLPGFPPQKKCSLPCSSPPPSPGTLQGSMTTCHWAGCWRASAVLRSLFIGGRKVKQNWVSSTLKSNRHSFRLAQEARDLPGWKR